MKDNLNREKFLKLMWVSERDGFIWNILTEQPYEQSPKVLSIINKYLDIETWSQNYKQAYDLWLNDDCDKFGVYDVHSKLNQCIITKLEAINKDLELLNLRLFYWFDVERDKKEFENFTWEKSPISGEELCLFTIENGEDILLDNKFFLIFPTNFYSSSSK